MTHPLRSELRELYGPIFPGISGRAAARLHRVARFAFDDAPEVPYGLRAPRSLGAWLAMSEGARLAALHATIEHDRQVRGVDRSTAHNAAQAALSRRMRAQHRASAYAPRTPARGFTTTPEGAPE